MLRRVKVLSSNSQFLRLWIGLTQSRLGSLINMVALTLYVYDQTESAAAVGKLEISIAIPSVVVGLFAGVIVDRYSRKWIMITADAVRAVLFLAMALVHVIPVIYVIVFASSLVGLFFGPAYSSSLPTIIDRGRLMDANSLSEMTTQLARVVGPSVAALLYTQFGLGFVCIFNSVTFAISAAVIMTLSMPSHMRDAQNRFSLASPLGEAFDGFRRIWSSALSRWILLLQCGIQLGAGAIVVLIVVFVKEGLGGGDASYGVIISAIAAGSVAGAAVVWFRGKLSDSAVLKVSLLAQALLMILISITSVIWIASILFVFLGLAQTVLSIAVSTLLQQHVPQKIMGRMFATMGVLVQVCQLLSMGTGGLLADEIGVRAVYIIGSSIILVTALLALRFMTVPSPIDRAEE